MIPLLRAKAGKGVVWTVDPVDGTANFVNGNDRFCVMVALANDGVPQQSWIWLPLHRTLYHATAGGGAEKVHGGSAIRLRAAASSPSFAALVGGGNVKGLEGQRTLSSNGCALCRDAGLPAARAFKQACWQAAVMITWRMAAVRHGTMHRLICCVGRLVATPRWLPPARAITPAIADRS